MLCFYDETGIRNCKCTHYGMLSPCCPFKIVYDYSGYAEVTTVTEWPYFFTVTQNIIRKYAERNIVRRR